VAEPGKLLDRCDAVQTYVCEWSQFVFPLRASDRIVLLFHDGVIVRQRRTQREKFQHTMFQLSHHRSSWPGVGDATSTLSANFAKRAYPRKSVFVGDISWPRKTEVNDFAFYLHDNYNAYCL
jgi:hypothetical protein